MPCEREIQHAVGDPLLERGFLCYERRSLWSDEGPREASWRSGYAEDCKSLYGGSIPSEASMISISYSVSAVADEFSSVFRQ